MFLSNVMLGSFLPYLLLAAFQNDASVLSYTHSIFNKTSKHNHKNYSKNYIKKFNTKHNVIVRRSLPMDCKTYNNCTKTKCISCTNADLHECADPRNKTLPIVECLHEDDICFSKHNPFGVVTRGCFSTRWDPSFYVCACNLCNYLAIQEMPFFFSTPADWKENVIAITRINHFSGDIFRNMECLECEVQRKDADYKPDTNAKHCLEGDLEKNRHKICEDGEVCGMKVVREDYLWRGCLQYPVYNSWWALCEEDHCNRDKLMLLSDIKLSEV